MQENNNNNSVSVYVERYNSLIDKYGKEKVYTSIEKLSLKNKEIICSYFGINAEKLSIKEIAEKYARHPDNVRYHLSFSINKIDELLSEPKRNLIVSTNREKEFFERYKSYSKEEIDNAFNKMEGLGKEVILSYYGLGRVGLSPIDISHKYDIKYRAVFGYLKNGLKIFERNLNNIHIKEKDYHTIEQFYSKFKEFSQEEVNKQLLILNETTQDILNTFYGLKGDAADVSEIASKLNLDSSAIYEIVNNTELKISKLLKNERKQVVRNKEFYSFFEGCNEEQINKALSNLDDKKQDILKSYYGLNCPVLTMEAIGKKHNLTRSRIDQIIKANMDTLKEFLSPLEEKKKKMQDEFYQKFKGYSKEEIDSALLDLKKRDRDIISYYYGFKEEILDAHQLAEKYCLSYYAICSILKKKLEVISDLLKNPSLKIKIGKKGFYNRFANFTKEDIDAAFRRLPPYDRRMLSLYYGLEDECLTGKELANRLNLDEENVYYNLKSILKKIEKILKHPESDVGSNKEEFYELFKGFSTKQIKQAMMGMKRKNIEIMVMYYGLNGKSKGLDYIAKKYSSYQSVVLTQINNNIKHIRKGLIDIMKKQFLLDINSVNITNIKKAMATLNENDLKLISLYYGLNGEDIMSKLEISEKINVSEDAVNEKINKIIEIIKTNLTLNKR